MKVSVKTCFYFKASEIFIKASSMLHLRSTLFPYNPSFLTTHYNPFFCKKQIKNVSKLKGDFLERQKHFVLIFMLFGYLVEGMRKDHHQL